MAVLKCVPIHGSAGSPTYAASDIRNMLAGLIGGTNFESLTPGIGIRGRGHGVLSSGSMAVTANGTPNNHVFVAAGLASVRGTQSNDQGAYVCPLSSSFDITVPAAHATLDRRDLIVAQVKDGEFAAFSGSSVWTPELVQGTPAGSPVDPTVPEDCLVLARLLVRDSTEAGGTIVRPQDITDLRVQARAGAITPVTANADWINPQANDIIFNRTTRTLLVRNEANSTWEYLAGNEAPTVYTPSWGASGTAPSIGNGTIEGHYLRLGRTLVFRFKLVIGSTTNPGTGTWEIGVPATFDTLWQGGNTPVPGLCQANQSGTLHYGLLSSGVNPARVTIRDRVSLSLFASNVPFTWATGHFLETTGAMFANA